MQYFVSAEKNSYFYWQLELLIYSFKRFNLENNLVIALAESESGGKATKYLSQCTYMLHDNHGKKFGYSPINKIHAVAEARKRGILKTPFVMIDPDMLLLNPILVDFEEDIMGNYSWSLEINNLKNNQEDKYEYIKKYEYQWIPIGPILLIKKDSGQFYQDVLSICLDLISTKKFWWPIEMFSWVVSICKNNFTMRSSKVFESYINSNYDSNFIHYCHGGDFIDSYKNIYGKECKIFSKHNYKNAPEGMLYFEPYYDIMNTDPKSLNILKMQHIVKEFLETY